MANINAWYDQLESKIFNKVADYIDSESGEDVFCTTDEVNVLDTDFPCVWIHELEYVERGQDLKNVTLNGVLYTMQIDVYALDKSEAKKLMRFAVAKMKALKFNVPAMPITMQISADVYHTVARFRRVIGGLDTIK